MADDGRRVDVWLWQARFCKTRAAASRLADSGVIRLTRGGHETRLDKASRTVRSGDQLVFAVSGRIAAIRVLSLGVRRGPPAEARTLYETLGGDLSPPNTAGGGRRSASSRRRRRRRDPTPPLTSPAPA